MAIRATQVIAYELWAAAVAILTFVIPSQRHTMLYVDNQPALQCLIKAYSKVPDLNNIAGGVMHRLSLSTNGIFLTYVESSCNLADGPSRDALHIMSRLDAEEVCAVTPDWEVDSLSWLPSFA